MSIIMSDSAIDLKKIVRKQWMFFPWMFPHFCMIRTFWAKIASTRFKKCLHGKPCKSETSGEIWGLLPWTIIYIRGVVNLETSHPSVPWECWFILQSKGHLAVFSPSPSPPRREGGATAVSASIRTPKNSLFGSSSHVTLGEIGTQRANTIMSN